MWRIRNVEPQRRVRLTTEFPMNIVEPILFQARHDPPAPAMCAPGTALGIISYARLARFIHSVGHRAVRLGVAPGQVVAIHVKDHIFHAALALGFMHVGIVTVSIGASLPLGLRADVILTDEPAAFANGRSTKIVAVDLSWMSGKGVPVDERHVYRGSGNDFCRIALTSGSTGEPRAVGFTHNNQLARLARYNHVFGNLFPQYSRFFSDYGLGSSGGFRHILYVLSRGGTMFFPGASPMETLQTFALYNVQGLIASPGGLSGFLTFYDTNRDFPCNFDIILSAGSPLPDPLSQQVRARMGSNLIFYYGTTETSTIASAPAHALTGLAGAVGYVTPDVSVQIVDDNGNSVPANREGSVRVRTPVSVKGYLDDPQQAGTPFRDGYFDTGDIGYLTDENMLVISGRKKEILNLGGDKVSPRTIEDALRAFYGIRDAAAFSVANGLGIDEVWALVVPHGRLNEEALQKHCRERLAQTHVPVRFINVADIPRNANGKADRGRLNAMVQGFTASTA
jgi:acyl-CoA synthetase (AMP-forming)/AMP-acid ligase II